MICPDLYAFQSLWRHYRRCRRNKRNTLNALAFEIDAESNLLGLQQELRTHAYRPGRSICFLTDGPKPREVFAADFRDRIVHHLLVSHQERIFEPMFIHDSYACRKGKGALAASDRLMTFLRQATANGRRPAWALKLDVASFFPSVDKSVLNTIPMRHIGHPELRWLTRTVLFHDPTTDYRFRSRACGVPGPGSRRYSVPAHKSLFGKRNEYGLPIGNLTSQFWGNVYLDPLDHFVKRTLKCRYYLRYVDDMVLLAPERAILVRWCAAIEQFLRERLHLALRPDMLAPFRVRRDIDFVGWTTWWNRRLPRRRTVGTLRTRTRLAAFEHTAVRPMWGGAARCIDLRRQRRRRQHRPPAGDSGFLCRASAPRCGAPRRAASGTTSGRNFPGWRRCSRIRGGLWARVGRCVAVSKQPVSRPSTGVWYNMRVRTHWSSFLVDGSSNSTVPSAWWPRPPLACALRRCPAPAMRLRRDFRCVCPTGTSRAPSGRA